MTHSLKLAFFALAAFAMSTGCGSDDNVVTAGPCDLDAGSGGTDDDGAGGDELPPPDPEEPSPVDPLAGWAYRVPLMVTHDEAQALVDHQVDFFVDTATLIAEGKMRSDGGDVRIADADGSPLPYWIEYGIGEERTRIWTKIPEVPVAGTWAYLYYGNPDAETAASGSATFELFDDFLGDTLDTSTWTVATAEQGAVSVADGELHLTATPGSIYNAAAIIGPAVDGANMEASAKLTATEPAGSLTRAEVFFRSTSSGFYWGNGTWMKTSFEAATQSATGSVSNTGGVTLATTLPIDASAESHHLRLWRYGDSALFTHNHDRIGSFKNIGWATEEATYPSLSANSYSAAPAFHYSFDWVFVTKRADTEVFVTLEETL